MMTNKKTTCEETRQDTAPQASLKELAAGDLKGHCAEAKGYDYDKLRGRKQPDRAEALKNRIWFDDLPPHTD